MYTQCPECRTIFEIDEDMLQVSLGIVQCGHCSQRFDALRTLSDTLPLQPLFPPAGHDPAGRTPTVTVEVPLSTIEAAVRKRHRHDELVPTAEPPGAGSPTAADSTTSSQDPAPEPSGENADDWFESMESELEAPPSFEADDTGSWAVEWPDQAGAPEPDSGELIFTGEDDGEAAVATEPGEPFDDGVPPAADEANPQEPGSEPDLPGHESSPPESSSSESATPSAEVVSPMLLQDDTACAEADASPTVDADIPEADASAQAPADADSDADPATTPTPVYVRPRRRPVARSAWGAAWGFGCLVLALVLAAQLAWSQRVDLFRDATTHAWTARVCATIDCHLPPIRDVAKLELVSRDIRPDPRAPGALAITASVRNTASFRQPWPVVVVELTDLDNHPVAMRRFRPAEYMPDPGRRAAGIAPGATAVVAFEVADPGKSASGFHFGFE
ncbi:MAG: zinc-ribbon and DUF3426 domain-containing protein [Rhodanobacteraceae bacterium]